ncbi:hypothetical protein ACI48D_06270 [Massilia sp. LXY-6]|uniref:hypothetical protein n=1 Tax=Massilia sp. LXY-6 TaxID=3379823 RepID=UPI003EE2E179
MKTLTIKDLARTHELDHHAMAAVRGGHSGGYSGSQAPWYPSPEPKKSGPSLDATQDLTQLQKVVNATANGSAFIDCVDVTNNTHQYGQNNILVG